jgi:hypothetical protein
MKHTSSNREIPPTRVTLRPDLPVLQCVFTCAIHGQSYGDLPDGRRRTNHHGTTTQTGDGRNEQAKSMLQRCNTDRRSEVAKSKIANAIFENERTSSARVESSGEFGSFGYTIIAEPMEASKLVTRVTNFDCLSTSVRLFERVKKLSKVYPEPRRSKVEETERSMTQNRICRVHPAEYQVDCLLDFLVSWSLGGEISCLSSRPRGSAHMPEAPATMH